MTEETSKAKAVFDRAVTAGANAMYQHAILQAERQAHQVPVDVERVRRVMESAIVSDDRSAAVVIFALYDDMMVQALRHFLNPDIKGGVSTLFDGFGMLYTANSRITMLAALYWISPKTYNNLTIFRRIRNILAHEPEVGGLADLGLSGLVNSITKLEEPLLNLPDVGDFREIALTDRQKFIARGALLTVQLARDLSVGRAAQANRVAPQDMYGKDWEGIPDRLKELHRIAAKVVLRTFGVDEARLADQETS